MPRGHKKLPEGPPDPNSKTLTAKMHRFVENFVDCGMATKAAEKAGYASPRVASQTLMQHPLIQRELQELRAMVRTGRRQRLEKRIELADKTLERVMRSERDEKKGFEDHLEAARIVYEVAGLINKHTGSKAPYYENYDSRSDEELQFFIVHGYFPEQNQPLDGARVGAGDGADAGGGRALCAPGPAPDHGPDPSHQR